MRISTSEKKNSGNYFNCGSLGHFARDPKEKKEAQIYENYEVMYKMLLDHMKKENVSLPKAFIEKQEDREE